MNKDNYNVCSNCGQCILGETYHSCYSSGVHPSLSAYNYKCPDCKGEFNNPAINGIDSTATGNPKCPFCGREMKGLNQ